MSRFLAEYERINKRNVDMLSSFPSNVIFLGRCIFDFSDLLNEFIWLI